MCKLDPQRKTSQFGGSRIPFIVFMLLVALALMPLSGCGKKPVQPTVPPPPGAVNQLDATAFRVLSDAQAAINSVKDDVTKGTVALSPAQKTVFNQIILDYDVAEGSAQAYHATGAGDTVALTKAINQLVQDIATITTQLTAKPGGTN